MDDLLVRDARLVPLDGGPSPVVDVRIRGGVVAEVGRGLPGRGEAELAASGRWVAPGLWDAHLHAEQWVRSTTWLPLAGVGSAAQACARVAQALAGRVLAGRSPAGRVLAGRAPERAPDRALIGFGHRIATWPAPPTVAELDAVTGALPVVLVAGDVHSGWLNSAALAALGVAPRAGMLAEDEWFAVFARLGELPGAAPATADWRTALTKLASLGVVGIVDLELTDAWRAWPALVAAGLTPVRVRAGVYPDQLDAVIAAGLRSGDPLDVRGLVRMGPLKVISDGSMGTRTAWCCEPYAPSPAEPGPHLGAPNVTPAQLQALLARAREAGLEVAVHAIGDAANAAALAAFATTGARGCIEHAQLLRTIDLPRFAELGVTASVQPVHLLDDRDAAEAVWPDRTARLYPFRSLLDAGARLAFGSDAPVSPPDPWGAMAAAVLRSGDDRDGWHPEQAITPREALAASVDGVRIAPGAPGDLVVLAADPLAASEPRRAAAVLRRMNVVTTVRAGAVTFRRECAR